MTAIMVNLTPELAAKLATIRGWLSEDSGGVQVSEAYAVELLIAGHYDALREGREHASQKRHKAHGSRCRARHPTGPGRGSRR